MLFLGLIFGMAFGLAQFDGYILGDCTDPNPNPDLPMLHPNP